MCLFSSAGSTVDIIKYHMRSDKFSFCVRKLNEKKQSCYFSGKELLGGCYSGGKTVGA
jgi:hypothetical protein